MTIYGQTEEVKSKTKVSIITVTYNAKGCLEETIKSVLSQTYTNIEYIIIDGGSSDGTLDIINRYKHMISKVVSEKDSGIYDAMNKGVKIATGEIIYFLNADDRLYDTEVVTSIIEKFLENCDIKVIYGNVIYVNKNDGTRKLRRYGHITRDSLLYEDLCHQAVFVKRFLFLEIGNFDIKYKIVADYDWLLRVFLLHKYPVAYVNRIFAEFTCGGYHTINVELNRSEHFMVRLKYLSRLTYGIGELIYKVKRRLRRIFGITV